jgi:hypothetical protein
MNINYDAIGQLLSHLTEGLNVEVKTGLLPQPAGAAKIVKELSHCGTATAVTW